MAFVSSGVVVGRSAFRPCSPQWRKTYSAGAAQGRAMVTMQAEDVDGAPRGGADAAVQEKSSVTSGLFDADPLGGELFNSTSSSFMTQSVEPMSFPDFEAPEIDVSTLEERRELLFRAKKVQTREKFKTSSVDCGSPEFQIASLTIRIEHLTLHLREHPKDHSTKRGLQKMVETRKKLFRYLYKEDINRCTKVISDLGIRFNLNNLIVKSRYG